MSYKLPTTSQRFAWPIPVPKAGPDVFLASPCYKVVSEGEDSRLAALLEAAKAGVWLERGRP